MTLDYAYQDRSAELKAGLALDARRRAARIWQDFDIFVGRESIRWALRAHSLLLAEGERAAAGFEAGGEDAALAAVSEERWQVYINALWLAIVPRAGQLLEPWLPKAAADPFIEATARYLRQYGAKRAGDLSRKSKHGIAEQIRIGIKKGESQREIAKRINNHYRSVSKTRAKTIARTEVHAAANFGSLTAAEQVQVPLYKIWIHTPDGRARDTHIAAEGQRRMLDKLFQVGGYLLMFPGDSSYGAPPEITVNCRCTMRYERAVKPVPVRPIRRRPAA